MVTNDEKKLCVKRNYTHTYEKIDDGDKIGLQQHSEILTFDRGVLDFVIRAMWE